MDAWNFVFPSVINVASDMWNFMDERNCSAAMFTYCAMQAVRFGVFEDFEISINNCRC